MKKVRRGERKRDMHFVYSLTTGCSLKWFISHMSRTWTLHRPTCEYLQEVILLTVMLIFTPYDPVSV